MYTQFVLPKNVLDIAKIWIPLAIISTFLCGLLALVMYQYMRQSANDPQIELVQERVELLFQNTQLQEVVPSATIDIDKSLAPFVVVFDDQGQVIASSVLLDGKTPTPPKGVLEYAKSHGDNRFTWAPKENVRIAAVVMPFTGDQSGYVLAGRSLREFDKRIYQLSIEVLGAWIASLIVSLFAITLLSLVPPKK